MSDSDQSLDLAGFGKLANAIPDPAWQKLVDTACDTFSSIVFPLTATTEGLGRLIKARFDRLTDVEKVLAADAVQKAQKKVANSSNKVQGKVKSTVMISAIERASVETDKNIRDIWANLIANELLGKDVHPEFPLILERLSSNEALVLVEIAESSQKDKMKQIVKAVALNLNVMGLSFASLVQEETDFYREHLKNLALIRSSEGTWRLTLIGEKFLESVSDPSMEA